MATVEERLAKLEEMLGGADGELYNSAHTGEQIDSAVTSVLNNEESWSGKSEKGETTTLVLLVDGWDETMKTQTLTDPLLKASAAYRYLVGASTSELNAFSTAGIRADDITMNGEITFHCEVVPETDLTVEIIRMEVKYA